MSNTIKLKLNNNKNYLYTKNYESDTYKKS